MLLCGPIIDLDFELALPRFHLKHIWLEEAAVLRLYAHQIALDVQIPVTELEMRILNNGLVHEFPLLAVVEQQSIVFVVA